MSLLACAMLNHLPTAPGERREKRRYALQLAVRYRTSRGRSVSEMGVGVTRDVSSKSIAFTCSQPINGALMVDLWIEWPVALDGQHPLRLVVQGRVLRTSGALAVVQIARHEFHTASRLPAAPRPAQI